MDKYFKLDPYQNYYNSFKLSNELRWELLELKCPLLDGSSNDYKIVNGFLERRFNESLEEIFFSVFKIDFRLIETKLVFNENHYYVRDVFYNERLGKYIHGKCAELMLELGVVIEFGRKNQLLFEVFIETCNLISGDHPNRWEKIKEHRKINTLEEFFIGRLRGEFRLNVNIMYKEYYEQIIEQLPK